jgi:hypothetical protein
VTTLLSPSPRKLVALLVISFLISVCALCVAQQPQSSSDTTNVTDTTGARAPYRVTNQRTEENGRVVEKQVYESPSINGGYAATSDVEQETIKVNDSTTRVIKRAYTRDASGNRQLFQITEEERTASPDGREKTVRSTSRVDNDNRWQVVERETEDAAPTGKDSRKVTSTLMRQGANGLVAVQQTQTTEQRTGNTTRSREVISNADPNGSFQPSAVKETVATITKDGITTDEKTLADDGRGQMVVVGRTVTNETKNAVGQSQQTVQEYSANVPGATPDGTLHLVRQSTENVQRDASGAVQTQSQTQTVNAGNPTDSLQTVTTATGVSQPTGRGQSDTKTTVRDTNGGGTFGTVFVTDGHETKVLPPVPAQKQDKTNAPPK